MKMLENFQNAIALIQDTYTLTSKNPVLLDSTKWSLLIGLVWTAITIPLILASFVFFPLLIITLPILVLGGLGMAIVNNLLAAAHTNLVYRSVKGEKPTFAQGVKRAQDNLGDVLYLTVADMVVGWITSSLRSKGQNQTSMLGLIFAIFWSGLAKLIEEGFDVVRHYLLPDMINSERTFGESLSTLSKLKDRLPEGITGALAFDALSGAIGSMIALVFLPAIILSVLLIPVIIGVVLLPVVVIGLVLATSVTSTLIAYAKNTYFTLMWIQLNEPAAIEKVPEIKEYLKRESARVHAAK